MHKGLIIRDLEKLHVRIPSVCTRSKYKVEDRVRKTLTWMASRQGTQVHIYVYAGVDKD